MNVTPVGVKRSFSSKQLWLAAGATFALAIVGFAAEWYLEGYGGGQEVLLAAREMVKWVCSVAVVALTFTAIISSTGATVRRLFR